MNPARSEFPIESNEKLYNATYEADENGKEKKRNLYVILQISM